jgi:hypothetical protein
MNACPGCGEPRGGRYEHAGSMFCWPCWVERTGLGALPAAPVKDPDWVLFRRTIIDALVAVDPSRFHYIDRNTIVGGCPLCGDGNVRADFHDKAPRADLACSSGCAELDIAHAIKNRKAAR